MEVCPIKVYLYIVKASTDPDKITCRVPYKVDEEFIFFGPCKKKLREEFFKNYLKSEPNGKIVPPEEIYIVGVNGLPPTRVRKIVWVGKIINLYTFQQAFMEFIKDPRFQSMINEEMSPLHVEPILEGDFFKGYRLRKINSDGESQKSRLHEENNNWIRDLTNRRWFPQLSNNEEISLKDMNFSNRQKAFNRDCCFTCKNIFYATNGGLQITSQMVDLLPKCST